MIGTIRADYSPPTGQLIDVLDFLKIARVQEKTGSFSFTCPVRRGVKWFTSVSSYRLGLSTGSVSAFLIVGQPPFLLLLLFFPNKKNNFNNGRRRSRSFSFLPTFDVSGYSAGTLHIDLTL